jgi:hypothetical protein
MEGRFKGKKEGLKEGRFKGRKVLMLTLSRFCDDPNNF